MWEEEEVAWGTSEGRRWHGNTTVVEMVKVDEKKKGWSTSLSSGRGERHRVNRSNHPHQRSTLKIDGSVTFSFTILAALPAAKCVICCFK